MPKSWTLLLLGSDHGNTQCNRGDEARKETNVLDGASLFQASVFDIETSVAVAFGVENTSQVKEDGCKERRREKDQ